MTSMKMRLAAVAGLAVLLVLALLLYRYFGSSSFAPVKRHAVANTESLSPEQRGRLVFLKYGCSMCHGANAEKGISNPNAQTKIIPALIYTKEGYSPKELRERILKGATVHPEDSKLPLPPYRMPGWQGLMSDQEVNDLSAYLFSLMPKNTKEEW